MEEKENFLELLIRHLNNSAITDILLRLLTTIENNDIKIEVVRWLKKIDLVKSLFGLFDSKYTNQIHSNASHLLCDIIRISREQVLIKYESYLETKLVNSESVDNNDGDIEALYKNSLLEEIES